MNFLYKYRFILGGLALIISVLLELHGSSIAELNISNLEHNPLFGISRPIRSDEYNVNTMLAFSQYFNEFGYFSNIIRGSPTDMFIIYGQPVLDIAVIFRPFHWGYLFLSQGKGLSFFWVGRLIILFLVSFEMGMIFTKKNKILSLAYSLLITFSPLVQWWFAVNGLVEMLIFGQLSLILINFYTQTNDYYKRLLYSLVLIICVGGYILTFYPAWQIPLAYVFLAIGIWIVFKNWENFNYSKKDIALIILFLSILSLFAIYILSKSYETILYSINTIYPGSRIYKGGEGELNLIFDYMRTLFYPLYSPESGRNPCKYAYFISFFPLNLIIFYIVQFVQKRKDLLLNCLIVIYILFMSYYLISFPEIIGKVTLLGKTTWIRLLPIITFIDIIILIRGMSILKKIDYSYFFESLSDKVNFKKLNNINPKIITLLFSFLITGIVLLIGYLTMGEGFYTLLVVLILFIIFGTVFYLILNSGENKKNQQLFLLCVILISFLTGALANPIESGTDFYFNQPIIQETQNIVDTDPQGKWIVEGNIFINEIVGVGAPTLNSVNVYPNLEVWKKLDTNNEYYDVYNRYAHVPVILQNQDPTTFKIDSENYENSDMFILVLNINDLEKLNITYVLTTNDISNLSNENLTLTQIYEDNNNR
ncbi:hypothetical protein LJB96_00955, partial [Methanobrevibacter sp. OttesenSCG-928-K11]|nr:hypothetical protein [Methanobrevibacter sp. OttesenSCG-928-K11]